NSPPGSFAVQCRACPVPYVNLPQGWEDAPVESSWLYRLILSQDANFRLKNRLQSSSEKDPSLQPGFAYFVANDAYLAHLATYVNNDEISHCVGFAALWLANNKKSKGLRATGVAAVSCSRHQFFRPNGTGDLQKGESKKFSERMNALPKPLQFAGETVMSWAVPKFHLPAHKPDCHGPFALNYMHGAGRTDGEGVERNWAWLNGAAPSTSQMGPGSRHDTLDDFIGFSNFRKTVDYGNSLLRALVQAIPDAIMHYEAFQAFTNGLKNEHACQLVEWEKTVRVWEKDKSTSNDPYLVEEEVASVHEIERQLAEEDRRQSTRVSYDVSPSTFIICGLTLEVN
ncbi:hypothetical protein H0H92_010922, partial [Tricholoma furcatifolium]